MSENTQHKLSRVRPPRVQITYDLELGGAIEKKELPFVIGIMSDLSGQPEEPLPKLKERKFVEIDPDNFNEVLAACRPRIKTSVANHIEPEGEKIGVELNIRSMDDFKPIEVVKQVPKLAELYKARQFLFDMAAKLDGNDKLIAQVKKLLASPETVKQLAAATTEGSEG